MRVLFAVVVLLLLVGCVGERGPEPLHVSEEAGATGSLGVDAYDEDGDGVADDNDGDGEPDVKPFILDVTVVAADTGAPLDGAGVVFRIFDCDWCSQPAQQVGLRTDGNGTAHLEMYLEAQVHVVAGLDNHTTEDAQRIDSVLGTSRSLTISLFNTTRETTVLDAYPLAIRESVVVTTPAALYEAQRTQEWRFHENDLVQAQYMERLTEVDVEISWVDSSRSSGFLNGIIGPSGSEGRYATTEGPPQPEAVYGRTLGEHRYKTTWDATVLEPEERPSLLQIGALLRTSTLSESGLQYAVTAKASFEGDEQYVIVIS